MQDQGRDFVIPLRVSDPRLPALSAGRQWLPAGVDPGGLRATDQVRRGRGKAGQATSMPSPC